MTVARMLLVVMLLSALAACNSDEGSGSSPQLPFRSLGKRADSSLGSERVGTSVP